MDIPFTLKVKTCKDEYGVVPLKYYGHGGTWKNPDDYLSRKLAREEEEKQEKFRQHRRASDKRSLSSTPDSLKRRSVNSTPEIYKRRQDTSDGHKRRSYIERNDEATQAAREYRLKRRSLHSEHSSDKVEGLPNSSYVNKKQEPKARSSELLTSKTTNKPKDKTQDKSLKKSPAPLPPSSSHPSIHSSSQITHTQTTHNPELTLEPKLNERANSEPILDKADSASSIGTNLIHKETISKSSLSPTGTRSSASFSDDSLPTSPTDKSPTKPSVKKTRAPAPPVELAQNLTNRADHSPSALHDSHFPSTRTTEPSFVKEQRTVESRSMSVYGPTSPVASISPDSLSPTNTPDLSPLRSNSSHQFDKDNFSDYKTQQMFEQTAMKAKSTLQTVPLSPDSLSPPTLSPTSTVSPPLSPIKPPERPPRTKKRKSSTKSPSSPAIPMNGDLVTDKVEEKNEKNEKNESILSAPDNNLEALFDKMETILVNGDKPKAERPSSLFSESKTNNENIMELNNAEQSKMTADDSEVNRDENMDNQQRPSIKKRAAPEPPAPKSESSFEDNKDLSWESPPKTDSCVPVVTIKKETKHIENDERSTELINRNGTGLRAKPAFDRMSISSYDSADSVPPPLPNSAPPPLPGSCQPTSDEATSPDEIVEIEYTVPLNTAPIDSDLDESFNRENHIAASRFEDPEGNDYDRRDLKSQSSSGIHNNSNNQYTKQTNNSSYSENEQGHVSSTYESRSQNRSSSAIDTSSISQSLLDNKNFFETQAFQETDSKSTLKRQTYSTYDQRSPKQSSSDIDDSSISQSLLENKKFFETQAFKETDSSNIQRPTNSASEKQSHKHLSSDIDDTSISRSLLQNKKFFENQAFSETDSSKGRPYKASYSGPSVKAYERYQHSDESSHDSSFKGKEYDFPRSQIANEDSPMNRYLKAINNQNSGPQTLPDNQRRSDYRSAAPVELGPNRNTSVRSNTENKLSNETNYHQTQPSSSKSLAVSAETTDLASGMSTSSLTRKKGKKYTDRVKVLENVAKIKVRNGYKIDQSDESDLSDDDEHNGFNAIFSPGDSGIMTSVPTSSDETDGNSHGPVRILSYNLTSSQLDNPLIDNSMDSQYDDSSLTSPLVFESKRSLFEEKKDRSSAQAMSPTSPTSTTSSDGMMSPRYRKYNGQELVDKARQFADMVQKPNFTVKTKGSDSDEFNQETLQEFELNRRSVISQSTVRKKDVRSPTEPDQKLFEEAEELPIQNTEKSPVKHWEVNTEPVKNRVPDIGWNNSSGERNNLFSQNIVQENESTDSVNRQSLSDSLHNTKRQWEGVFKDHIDNQYKDPKEKPKSSVRHWEVKLPNQVIPRGTIRQQEDLTSSPNKMADTESAIDREIRLANEREDLLRREKEERLKLEQQNGKLDISSFENAANSPPSNKPLYHEMTEADRGSEMWQRESLIQQELREQEEREVALKRKNLTPVKANQDSDNSEDQPYESIIQREIRLQREREEELERQRIKKQPVVVVEEDPVPSPPAASPVPQTNNNNNNNVQSDINHNEQKVNISYEDAISGFQHDGESRIAREMRELREREEEIRKQRELLQNNNNKQSLPNNQTPPKSASSQSITKSSSSTSINTTKQGTWQKEVSPYIQNHKRSDSVDSLASSQSTGRTTSDYTPSRDVKVMPNIQQDSDEESTPRYAPTSETPIQREIRLARERENELRRSKGLPEIEAPVEPTPLKKKPPTNTQNTPTSNYTPSPRSRQDSSGQAVRSYASSRLQQELSTQKQRELLYRQEGKIITTSEEHIEPMKYTEVTGSDQIDGSVKRNFKRSSISSNNIPSPETPPAEEPQIQPSPVKPIKGGGGASFSYKESRQTAESKIERELREMREREQELRIRRDPNSIEEEPESPTDTTFAKSATVGPDGQKRSLADRWQQVCQS
ncbi:serine-rich adhesin for platelets isoform X5 [Patella vulgata]|uniref:serine-rich adhesin for platelets isoform X5 n=1 Tax=Patella vulgata TaxID=6465 RepID=UPI0024A8C5AA|nr:serine-rich adhesin for platelets isoform X5 [Patella vulgata]